MNVMKYFVYIIYNLRDKKYYTGITNDLFRRLKEHNKIRSSTITTTNRNSFILVHAEQCEDRDKARERELFWKSGYGRELRDKFIKNLIS